MPCLAPFDDLVKLSRQREQERIAEVHAKRVVSIAELEEVAEIMACRRFEDAARRFGHFSAEANRAWRRLHRIGCLRRRLAAAPAQKARPCRDRQP